MNVRKNANYLRLKQEDQTLWSFIVLGLGLIVNVIQFHGSSLLLYLIIFLVITLNKQNLFVISEKCTKPFFEIGYLKITFFVLILNYTPRDILTPKSRKKNRIHKWQLLKKTTVFRNHVVAYGTQFSLLTYFSSLYPLQCLVISIQHTKCAIFLYSNYLFSSFKIMIQKIESTKLDMKASRNCWLVREVLELLGIDLRRRTSKGTLGSCCLWESYNIPYGMSTCQQHYQPI